MTRTPWLPWALLVLALLFVGVWATRPDPIPPEVLSPRVDSALVAARARAVVLDSVRSRQLAVDDSVRAEQAARELRVAVLVREAATWERIAHASADSARTLGDTLGLAWSAYRAENQRADSLTVALVVSDSARRTAEYSAEMWRMAYNEADDSRRQLSRITGELREAVDRATRANQCRIVGAIPCPSRTVVAVTGLAIGAAGILYVDR